MGLAAALGASSRGCRSIAIVDQTRGFGEAGEYVDLQGNGVRALRLIAPRLVKRLLGERGGSGDAPFEYYDSDAKHVASTPRTLEGMEPTIPLAWSALQKALLDELPGGVEVFVNSQLVAADDCEKGGEDVVRAEFVQNRRRGNRFANWGGERAGDGGALSRDDGESAVEEGDAGGPVLMSLFARVVIGADGINSVCREIVYRSIGGEAWVPLARPQYSGMVQVKGRGTVSEAENADLEEMRNAFLPEGGFGLRAVVCTEEDLKSYASPVVILAHLRHLGGGDTWMFIVQCAVEEHLARQERDAGGATALYKQLLDILQDAKYSEGLLRAAKVLLTEAEGGEGRSFVSRPLFVVPVDHPVPYELPPTAGGSPPAPEGFFRPFGFGRIFLAGDSLHGMPTFTAQGTAMGFEDVVELVDIMAGAFSWSLSEVGSASIAAPALHDVLQKYRKARIARLSAVQRNTVNRISVYDNDARTQFREYALDFQPIATGWEA